MKSLTLIGNILQRELKRVISDHSIFLTVIAAPILYGLFLGSIYLNKDINKVPVGVVDYDHSHTSRELIRQLSASPKLKVVKVLASHQEAAEHLKRMEIQGYVVFPQGFEKELLRKKGVHVNLFLNTTRFLPSNTINMAVNKVMLQAGTRIRTHYFESDGVNSKTALGLADPVQPNIRPIYNPINAYGDFLLPALFFIILQQTLILGIAESISKDRQTGLLEPVLQSSPQSVIYYMIGKPIYYMVLYAAYLLFFTWVIFPVFQLPVAASLLPVYAIGLLFILTTAMYALLIGSFIKKQTHAMEILAFSTYPLFLLSGYSWPLSSMPAILRGMAALIPTTPMLEAMRRLYLMGGSWQDVVPQFQHLILILGFSALLLTVRLVRLRNRTSERRMAQA